VEASVEKGLKINDATLQNKRLRILKNNPTWHERWQQTEN